MTVTIGRQLGTTSRAEDLIPGRPAALYADADAIAVVAQQLLDAATDLGRIDTTSWRGQASEAFAAATEALRAELTTAAQCHAVAAAALSDHGAVLAWAQEEARAAIRQHAAGAACVEGAPGLGPALTPAQLRAANLLDDARIVVHRSAAAAAGSLDEAVSRAPRPGGFWNDVGKQWSSFWHGAVEPVGDLANLVWQQNQIRMLIDPDAWWRDRAALIAGLWASVQDPKRLGKDLLDWDTWAHDPARAAGHLVPDAILTVLTGGAGGAAAKGASTAAKAAEEAAEEAAEVAAKTAAKDTAARAGEQAAKDTPRGPGGYTEDELARPTPGTAPVVFRANANMNPAEIQQAIEWVRGANEARLAGALSDTGRVAITDELRAMSKAEAALERARATQAGTPYTGVASHIPDRTWLSDKPAWVFGDHTKPLNSSFAGEVGRFPVGTIPTMFQFRMLDGRVYPEIVEGGLP